MKQSQWVFAGLALAALVFLFTFIMNFVGKPDRPRPTRLTNEAHREVRFLWKAIPYGEAEEGSKGQQDFWFVNDNQEPVEVGLYKKGCKCTAVELFLLDGSSKPLLAADAAFLVGTAWVGPVSPLATVFPVGPVMPQEMVLRALQGRAGKPHELLHAADAVRVPGGAVGWVRLSWKALKGPAQMSAQAFTAELWMDNKGFSPTLLETRARFHTPIRVQKELVLGILRDDALRMQPARGELIVWSSTRLALDLQARDAQAGDNPATDPFVVGRPVPLSAAEVRQLEIDHNTETSFPLAGGRVLCAYRVGVSLAAVSADGKTPCELGPFHRTVLLSSPGVPGEPVAVTVRGRVRGDIEIGNEDEGEIKFRTFARSKGKRARLTLLSEVPNLELRIDTKRTPKYLKADLGAPETETGRRSWRLRVEVLPNEASGVFPRPEDPLYADSAVYLVATAPGKPPRRVRIAVSGTANAT